MSVKQRIKYFIKSENMTVLDFERKIEVANGYVNSISKGIGTEKLEKILEIYPNLNLEWLITGSGEMLKTNTTQAVASEEPAATSAEIIELATKLGEQINENKHLRRENMMLKAEIEQFKKTDKISVEYDIPKPQLMALAEAKAEYKKTK